MLSVKSQLTLQEFLALPAGDVTYELIEGQAIAKMSPKYFHSRLTFALLSLLDQWCQGRGQVCPEWAVTLSRQGQDWVPVPDVLYVSSDRLSTDWRQNAACPVAPELVIEIISPGQSFGELAGKARDYLDAGVLRVWVVDDQSRSITVFYADAPHQSYKGATILSDRLFPGLEITAEQVFEKAGI